MEEAGSRDLQDPPVDGHGRIHHFGPQPEADSRGTRTLSREGRRGSPPLGCGRSGIRREPSTTRKANNAAIIAAGPVQEQRPGHQRDAHHSDDRTGESGHNLVRRKGVEASLSAFDAAQQAAAEDATEE